MASLTAQNYKATQRAIQVAGFMNNQAKLIDWVRNDIQNKIQTGDSLSVSLAMPNLTGTVKGVKQASDYQDKMSRSRAITMDYVSTPARVLAADVDLTIEDFKAQVADPDGYSLGSTANKDILKAVLGSASVAVVGDQTFANVDGLVSVVKDSRVSGELYGVTSNSGLGKMRQSGFNMFVPAQNERNYTNWQIGDYAGARWAATADSIKFTAPDLDTFTATVTEGGSTAVLAGTFAVGTVIPAGFTFTVADCYSVDLLGKSLDVLHPFVVVEDFTVTTANTATVKIGAVYGPYGASANNAAQNVTAVPSGAKAATAVSVAGTTYEASLVWVKNSVGFVSRSLRDRKIGESSSSGLDNGLVNVQYWEREELYNENLLVSLTALYGAGTITGMGAGLLLTAK
jgi:hypothetical protein